MLPYENDGYMVVGKYVMFLSNRYDKDQYWLPFVNAVFHDRPDDDPSLPPIKQYKHSQCRWTIEETATSQYILPFPTFKKISSNQYKYIRQHGFLTFDRNEDGDRYHIMNNSRVPLKEQYKWFIDNMVGRFVIKRNYAIFEQKTDYAFVKLSGKLDG